MIEGIEQVTNHLNWIIATRPLGSEGLAALSHHASILEEMIERATAAGYPAQGSEAEAIAAAEEAVAAAQDFSHDFAPV